MREYDVARATAREALSVLRHAGLVTVRQGAGVFVAPRTRLVRDATNRYSRTHARHTSPFRSDATQAGQHGDWEHNSEPADAPPAIAERLAIAPGDPVMHTTYRYFSDGQPIQISRSWEPLAITGDTAVTEPENGPITGVIARMDTIGVHVTHVVERVTTRAATPDEADQLALPQRGTHLLAIERTHVAETVPVETCDILVPGDRYELTYTIAVAEEQ